jgi:hypothetical protein
MRISLKRSWLVLNSSAEHFATFLKRKKNSTFHTTWKWSASLVHLVIFDIEIANSRFVFPGSFGKRR